MLEDGDMRLTPLMVPFVVTLAVSVADAQVPAVGSVHIGVFGYRADGSINVSAWDTLPSTNALVFASGSGCRMGAGHREPPDHATDAWRFSGKVLSADASAAVVLLNWRRVLDQGSAAATESTVELTIQRGEKIVLDHIAAPAPTGCSATSVLFEAHYGSRPVAGSRATSPDEGPAAAATGRVRAYRVRLWFIGRRPGEPEQVISHPELVTTREASFAFPPVMSGWAGGNMRVFVTGSFEIRNGANGEEFVFNAQRRATPFGIGGLRDRPADIYGDSTLTMPLPGPDEVLAFEMPPIRLHGGAELPDRFSVRVQIAPRKLDR
jgi:hypothetical protein